MSVGYSVGASSGTVSAGFAGAMAVDYTPVLASPGATSLGLSFQGGLGISIPEICVPGVGCIPAIDLPGASLTSDLGAHATLSAGPASVGPDFTLGIDAVNPAQLGQVVSGSSSATVAQVPAADIVLASAGASLGVTQTDYFTASALTADLFYSRQGSGVVDSIRFALATGAGTSLSVELSDPGTWDFWFVDQTLAKSFSTFSVQVVPEPGTAWLLGAGLGVLGWIRRKEPRGRSCSGARCGRSSSLGR